MNWLAEQGQILSVAVPRPIHTLFTYRLPKELASLVRVGGWVKVPFGRKLTQAFVVSSPQGVDALSPGLAFEDLKEIAEVGPETEVLPEDVFALCRWASDYYGSPLGEVIQCAATAVFLGLSKLKRPPKKIGEFLGKKNRHELTPRQKEVADQLSSLPSGQKVALLKGVTGSGKTEVYLELAQRALQAGQGVLILVPEIALTPQLFQRIEKGLGVPIALWHSAVSEGRRRDQSLALRNREIRVVVGARSAVFSPIPDLGLIVVDEEHDSSYKQEDRVCYHARDLAIVRSKLTGAITVLGSATPSLETRERVREGKYFYTELPDRIAAAGLPRVELVDLCEAPQVEGIQAHLATKTLQEMQDTLEAGQQVMVYLNRRGFAAFLICKDCKKVSGCPECSVSLTVHKYSSQLRCHVCGYREPIPDQCSKCQGLDLIAVGAGTESLESELPGLFSAKANAKVLRLDRDQITSVRRLNQVLNDFRAGKANILLGTQMLVKGHDFPDVTLVVVIQADALFRWPDFRAPERALQILKQVAGRAGRGDKPGKVLIQTFDPEHAVLQVLAGKISEESFLENERELREVLRYPPYGRLARFRFESIHRNQVIDRSQKVAEELKKKLISEPVEILGPSEAFLEKAKGIYRWDLLIKSKNVQTLQKAVKFAREYNAMRRSDFQGQFQVDIDPYGI